jgi:hypothetical protein
MIKSVTNYPVSRIFDIEAVVVYAVPKYQLDRAMVLFKIARGEA